MRREPLAFIAAHPDDEVLGAGAQLVRDPPPLIVHVTDGAPRDPRDARERGFLSREAYAEARAQEAREALALAGIGAERIVSLGVVDQEAALSLAPLARRLARLLGELQVQTVFTHPYEGGHPDHDATAFVVHAACALLARERGEEAIPHVFEFTSYHASGGGLATGVFLAPNRAATPASAPDGDVVVELSAAAREAKTRMLASFRSQWSMVALFPVHAERFRRAPYYRFTVSPHPSPLHYERLGWGWTAERWRALAAAALDQLGLPQGEPL